jgi:hypothetical protein
MTTAPAIVDVDFFMDWFPAMPACCRESSIVLSHVEKPGCSRFLTERGLSPPLRRGETIAPHLTVQRPGRGNVTGSPFQNVGCHRISTFVEIRSMF